jgi:hypothetical protein
MPIEDVLKQIAHGGWSKPAGQQSSDSDPELLWGSSEEGTSHAVPRLTDECPNVIEIETEPPSLIEIKTMLPPGVHVRRYEPKAVPFAVAPVSVVTNAGRFFRAYLRDMARRFEHFAGYVAPPLTYILSKLADAGLELIIDAAAVANAHGVVVTDDDPFWGAMNAKAEGTRNEHRGRQHVREG